MGNVNMPESKIRQNYHEECEAMINKQINMEFYASYVYLSMGSYSNRQDQALHGFGKHFMGESEEERKHGIKLMEYQTKRVWVCILWTRRLEVKYPLCVSSPHIGKLFNSRQNSLLPYRSSFQHFYVQ